MFFPLSQSQKSISPEALRDLLASPPPNTLFIDVRTKAEWDTGHIEGFRNIPLDELLQRINELNIPAATEQEITPTAYFLCRSGGRSARACDIAEKTGRLVAVNVSGGILAWTKAGYTLIR